jgi:hypothetical protein
LPPGMIAMAGREIPFASALFHFRPLLRNYLFPTSHDNNQQSNKNLFQLLMQECLCGLMTSCVATPISHPASVIASYQQGHGTTLQTAIKSIYNEGIWKGFFRGVIPRTLSLAGTFTVVPIVLQILHNIQL